MIRELYRAWCPECGRLGDWLEDQDDAYREAAEHQAEEHPGAAVGLEMWGQR